MGYLLFNMPVAEADNVPTTWFDIIYYLAISFTSLVCGAFVVVVLMLYNTVQNIIKIVGLNLKDHPLAKSKDE